MKYAAYVAQVDESDCGVACLAMILKHYGSDYPIAKLRDLARTNQEGTNALALVKVAQKLGLATQAVQAYLAILDDPAIQFPWIAHVVKDGVLLHYYVIFGADENQVYVADPDPKAGVHKMARADFEQEWSGVALLFEPSADYQVQVVTMTTLKDNFRLLKPFRGTLALTICWSILISVISIVGSLYLQVLIDDLIPRHRVNLLMIVSLGMIIAYLIYAILSYLRTMILMKVNMKVAGRINLDYLRSVLHLPLRFFMTRKTGEILSRFNDISKIIDALSSTVVTIFLDAGMLVLIGLFMAWQNYPLFLTTLISVPIYIVLVAIFNRRYTKLNYDQMESNARLNSSIIESIRGIETVKALNITDRLDEQIDQQFQSFLKQSYRYTQTETFQAAIKLFLQYGLTTVILLVGSLQVMRNQLALGQLMAFNMLLAFFIEPLQDIVNLQAKLKTAQVANQRLNEVLVIEPEPSDGLALNDESLSLDVERVSFAYTYGYPALRDVSLSIQPGEKLAIIGPSGSGKSTLAKMMVRFLTPDQGSIKVNQRDIRSMALADLRHRIGYVPQRSQLFSGTIAQNLRLANPDMTLEELSRACHLAQIDADITKLPLGYDTLIDEESNTLSGGQVQRLAIARALLNHPQILILDESTSSLDPLTESELLQSLMALPMTIVLVSHRLNVTTHLDRVVVLDHGQIVQDGQPEDLQQVAGLYQQLLGQ